MSTTTITGAASPIDDLAPIVFTDLPRTDPALTRLSNGTHNAIKHHRAAAREFEDALDDLDLGGMCDALALLQTRVSATMLLLQTDLRRARAT